VNDDATSLDIEPFAVRVSDEVLRDLRARIDNTRLPEPAPGAAWEQGTDREYLRALLEYWADSFDWRAQERYLNGFEQFHAVIDGVRIHFAHVKARNGAGIPLILTHGWPSTYAEFLPLVALLTDPAAHGIEGPAFDLVIPSLPGYAFSERPARPVTYSSVAGLWRRLMRGLGYQRYGAGGSDFGSGIATYMGLEDPDPLIGLYLTNLELSPYAGPGSRPLSDAESAYLAQAARWGETERGYTAMQSTKPQTIGYGLNDSPAGLAAWILEKWRAWSDSDGDLDAHISRDSLLTTVTIYWVTQTITSSMRDYFDNRRLQGEPRLGQNTVVRVPTAIAQFTHMFIAEGEPPREWAERSYNIQSWTSMPSGRDCPTVKEPGLVARDIAAFFGDAVAGRLGGA
jgi:pimeloyl-ACP methyl ester carboxylesterase